MKKIFGIMIIAAVAIIVGYNVYTSQLDSKLSDLALANVEALADSRKVMLRLFVAKNL